jgi:two-component system, LytTR family, response regulator
MEDFQIDVVIVEDEAASQIAIQGVLSLAWPKARVLGIAASVSSAQILIQEVKPQLVLLDITLHDLSGFHVLEHFPNREFGVIILSAHAEFEKARVAITHGVKEYLLKPVGIDQLRAAISKCAPTTRPNSIDGKIQLTLHYGNQVFISIQDIVMIGAEGAYTYIYMANGEKHMVSKHMHTIEKLLPKNQFFRVHDSNVVNKSHIVSFDITNRSGIIALTNNLIAKVSSRKRGGVLKWLKQW